MNKLFATILLTISFAGVLPLANAQMMRGQFVNEEIYEHTIQEEAEGRALWEKLKAEEVSCAELSSEDDEALGEYFMGVMLGDAHAAMNAMMIQMMGEEGEEQMHEVMGRRLSGCDTAAAFPAGGVGWMPMMQMMWGGWSGPFGFGLGSMMGFGTFGFLGWVLMVLWWVLIIIVVVALIRWLLNQFKKGGIAAKSASDVLKERYVKGEISRKEFEEIKQAIS